MKKIMLTLFLVCISFILSKNEANAMGLFYTNATYPITATGVENKDLSKLKKGSASINSILFCVEWGNASIDKAIKNAEITQISHIDIHEKSIFIFWRKVTVNVYGE